MKLNYKFILVLLCALLLVSSVSASSYYLSNFNNKLAAELNFNDSSLNTEQSGQTTWTNNGLTESTNNYKFGPGAGNTSGLSANYIQLNTGYANMTFGTTNWTLSFWVYPTAISGSAGGTYLDYRLSSSASSNALTIYQAAYGTTPGWYVGTTNLIPAASNSLQLPLNQWSQIVLMHQNGTAPNSYIYINGTLYGSATDTTTYITSASRPYLMQKATPNTGTGNGAAGLVDSFNFWNVNVPIANLSPQTAEVGLLIDKPIASFSTNVTHGINPTGVSFTDTSSNGPNAWNWTFNAVAVNNTNVSFSTSQNPAYNFPTGNYSIYLNASNSFGYNISAPTWINVTEKLLSSFTAIPATSVQPTTVTYNATVNVAAYWYNLSYGDGTFYNQTTFPGTNLTHYYSTGGNYTNTFTTTYGESQVNTSSQYVQVYNTTTTSFTYGNSTAPYGQVAPATFQFNDTSINATLPTPTYYWMFGDGGTSTSATPVHIYAAAGTYTVNHSASNGQSTNWSNQTNIITVLPFTTNTTIKTFSNTGNTSFTVPYGVYSINIMAIAGGGAGAAPNGGTGGGGGGAGGVIITTLSVKPGDILNMNVGAGGLGNTPTGNVFTSGNDSFIWNQSSNILIHSIGGGAGAGTNGVNGGSGGGARLGTTSSGTAGQGQAGYTTGDISGNYYAGGGGGNQTAATSINGGNGLYYWITGSNLAYAGGGGGGHYGSGAGNPAGVGGIGGGGTGGTGTTASSPGVANTGGGGGGQGSSSNTPSGNGGSGIIIVAYNEAPLVASFTQNVTTGSAPPLTAVQFTDTSTGSPVNWNWTFTNVTGNNTPVIFSNSQSPVLSFNVGNYSISMKAGNATNGYSTSSQVSWVNITPLSTPPIVSFTSTTATGIVPLTVAYTDTSTNYPTSWKWNFTTGGTGVDSTTESPTYTYNNVGTYSVNFTAISSAGANSTIATNYVTVNPMVASITANTTYGAAPLVVLFNGTSTGSPNTYFWDFGDNTNSTLQNVTHTYSGIGTYNVNFEAVNTSSGAYAWSNHTSYIQATGIAPVSDFSGTPLSGIVPLNVTFTDASQNAPTSWNWSFGDGYTATTRNASHVYNATGSYTVNLTTANVMGNNTMSRPNYVTINPMVVTFSSNNVLGSYFVNAQFTASSTGSPDTWYWDFGDGNTSTIQNAAHNYTAVGNYNVNLRATNTSSGAFSWTNKTAYISVTGMVAPLASFTMSLTNSYIPMTVSFTDTSTNSPTSWNWSFGDGNYSISQNPTFVYNVPGTYTVNLTASNIIGSNTSTFKYLIATAVPLAPQANFTWSNTVGITLPVTVQFTDTSTQSPTSWYWSDFGDGSGQTSLLQNPTHVYNGVGAFPVTLHVTNVNGTASQITKYVQITSTTGGVTDTITNVGSTTVETLTGNGGYAWTCPSGVYSLNLFVQGAGAAGTNGGYSTGVLNLSYGATGGGNGAYNTASNIAVTPGQTYQFVLGRGGVSVNTTVNVYTVGPTKYFAVYRNGTLFTTGNDNGGGYVTSSSDPLSGGSSYAFGYTSNGGTSGLQYITGWAAGVVGYGPGSVTGAATNGPTLSISGTYVTYGGTGGGQGYVGGTSGGGNGYGYSGGSSTSGSFYGAGGGAGDTDNGENDHGGNGNNGVIILNYVKVSTIIPPVANFTGTPTSGSYPLTVQFTDYSLNGPTSWNWSFGDGGSSTVKNPLYTYNAAGSYTVSLTDSNSNLTSSGSMVRTNYINVTAPVNTTTTPAPQSSTVWFVPKTVQFTVVDGSGNIVPGASISGQFVSSSALPGGVQDLINYYGMNLAAANNAVNGTLYMNSTTDSSGQSVLTMLQTLTYNVTVTSGAITNVYTIYPQDSSYQLKMIAPAVAGTDEYTCVLSNGNTWTGAYNDINTDPYNLTLMFSYEDTCGLTNSLTYYVYDRGTDNAYQNVLAYTNTVSPVTSNIYKLNVTVANTRGENYVWYENYTRSV